MRSASLALLWCGAVAACAPAPVVQAPAADPPTSPPSGEPAAAAATPHEQGPSDRPSPRSFAEFRPSRDGFAFVNSFAGSSLPIDLGAAAESSLGLPRRFGLCGGMSSAAADYFLAGTPVPADTRPPARGSRLYDYLYQRQTASVGPSGAMALKFLEWMRLPDHGPDGCRARTAAELPMIRESLGRGEPVILGLVLTTAAKRQAPWNNHQVLAYSVGPPTSDGAEEIRIYDPNFPKRDDVVIRIAMRDGECECLRIVPGRGATTVRGLFRMPYAPAAPIAEH